MAEELQQLLEKIQRDGVDKAQAEAADIVAKAFWGPVTPQVPASILQMHPDVTLVADEEALSASPYRE